MSNKFVIATDFAIFKQGSPCFHTENLPHTPVRSYVVDGDWIDIHFEADLSGNDQLVRIPRERIRHINVG